jgi:hypothetical protein
VRPKSAQCKIRSELVENPQETGQNKNLGGFLFNDFKEVGKSRGSLIDCPPPLAPAKYISRGAACPAWPQTEAEAEDLYGCSLGDHCSAVFRLAVSSATCLTKITRDTRKI